MSSATSRSASRAFAGSIWWDRRSPNAGVDPAAHPLLARREERRVDVLVLTSDRGLCGGYNSNVLRASVVRWKELQGSIPHPLLEVSGKRGIAAFKFREIAAHRTFTQFEDKVRFDEIDALANGYLEDYVTGRLDRLDVAYTRFDSIARQVSVVETLLPLGAIAGADATEPSLCSSTERRSW